MGMTVREALLLPPLNGTRLLTGKNGLDNIINSVTVIDAPDSYNWLKGNELVLTTAYAIKSDLDMEKILKGLSKVNIAAFGIKLGRYVDRIPQNILAIAEELNIPIFNMPFNCSYIDIMNPILSNIFNKKTLFLEYAEQIYMHMTKTLLKGGNLTDIVQKLVDQVNAPVAVLSINNEILELINPEIENIDNLLLRKAILTGKINKHCFTPQVYKDLDVSNDNILSIIRKDEIKIGEKNYLSAYMPITNGNEIYGFLMLIKGVYEISSLEIIAMKYTAMVAALEILKQKSLINLEKKYKNDFVNDLLAGRFDSEIGMIIRGKYWGWNLEKRFSAIVIDIDGLQQYYQRCNRNEGMIIRLKERLLNCIERLLKDNNAIISDLSDTFVVLIPIDESYDEFKEIKIKLIELGKRLKRRLYETVDEVTVTIGIGRCYTKLKELQISYSEAKSAIEVGRLYKGPNNVFYFEDMKVFRLLSNHNDKEVLNSFLEDTIDNIIKYDSENNTDLMNILKQHYLCNCKIKETAKCLYMHENTIRYKLKKIEELTGANFNNIESSLNLFIGLKIYLLNMS